MPVSVIPRSGSPVTVASTTFPNVENASLRAFAPVLKLKFSTHILVFSDSETKKCSLIFGYSRKELEILKLGNSGNDLDPQGVSLTLHL